MSTATYLALGGATEEVLRYLAHRIGLAAFLVAVVAWVIRQRRLFVNVGERQIGMPHLQPIEQRKPEVVAQVLRAAAKAKKAAALQAAAEARKLVAA